MTFNDIFKSSFLEDVSAFQPLDMIIALALSLVLGLFIFMVYKRTFNGVMYSQVFGSFTYCYVYDNDTCNSRDQLERCGRGTTLTVISAT